MATDWTHWICADCGRECSEEDERYSYFTGDFSPTPPSCAECTAIRIENDETLPEAKKLEFLISLRDNAQISVNLG